MIKSNGKEEKHYYYIAVSVLSKNEPNRLFPDWLMQFFFKPG